MTEQIKQEIEGIVLKMSPEIFILEVERLVLNESMTYSEAIIQICEDRSIEPEEIAKLVPAPLKAKLKAEAQRRNLLPKDTESFSLY